MSMGGICKVSEKCMRGATLSKQIAREAQAMTERMGRASRSLSKARLKEWKQEERQG